MHLMLCSHIHVDINITGYLHSLDRAAVFNLGLVLGLDYSQLKAMIDSETLVRTC